MNQSTLNGLVRHPYRWSPFLPDLARALQTTVAYLIGETNDPEENAPPPPPPPAVHHVMMAVALPPERALSRMFSSLLDALPPEAAREDQARLLAQWLPTALGQIRDLLPEPPVPARGPALVPATADGHAALDHGSRS